VATTIGKLHQAPVQTKGRDVWPFASWRTTTLTRRSFGDIPNICSSEATADRCSSEATADRDARGPGCVKTPDAEKTLE
jgi:hypothetical protein